jgi:hypothetical protein
VLDERKRGAKNFELDDEDEFIPADGMIGRLVDNACDNPAMSGGLLVMAMTAAAIVSNAMFLQNVRHPEPLFSTRPPLVLERPLRANPEAIPIPPRRLDQTESIAPAVPVSAAITDIIAAKSEEAALVHDIQALLAQKGLYLGAIDGVYGELSRSAIAAYQEAEGLPVTGEQSAELLEHMKLSATKASSTLPPPVSAETPIPLPAARATDATGSAQERLRYERLQTALNRIGYGPVAVGGELDEPTVNAIRRFELDNGLPISGRAGDDVIDRLIAIGALPAT